MKTLQLIHLCKDKVKELEKMVPLSHYQNEINRIDERLFAPNIWNNPMEAKSLSKERQKYQSISEQFVKFQKLSQDFAEMLFLFKEEELEEIHEQVNCLAKDIDNFELKQIFTDEVDNSPAILTINAGAGGLEAANWVSILLRMYARYTDFAQFKIEILDQKPSKEHAAICTDSVSIRVEGDYAYGFLKGESGVHRLIRNSPFNAGDARHTSFAAVSVSPDIEDIIDIKIEERDIEITSQTAGGPGGQNQNRIKSAIRIKHLPTGIMVLARSERDQLSNKKTAFKILKSKLYKLELEKREQENINKKNNLLSINFGSQIRTYIESPQSLVKDHRSGFETSDYNGVLDGNIYNLITSYLRT